MSKYRIHAEVDDIAMARTLAEQTETLGWVVALAMLNMGEMQFREAMKSAVSVREIAGNKHAAERLRALADAIDEGE